MKKVLNITNILEGKKKEQQREDYRKRLETIQRVVQCSSCRFKCAMCGLHIESDDKERKGSFLGFNLCPTCRMEFEDFLKRKSIKTDKSLFWHTEAWSRLWSRWLEYQKALNGLRTSKEYKQINKELDI